AHCNCIRAFAHFWLLIHYRNVPVIKKSANNFDHVDRVQEKPIDVWNFIIKDLKKAKSLMPKKGYWPSSLKGRFTKGTAAALLGKVYLWMTSIEKYYGSNQNINKYDEAAKEFGDIIDGKYGNYQLVPHYYWNFEVAH